MDPTSNLKEQLKLAAELIAQPTDGEDFTEANQDSAYRLAELVEALNSWIQHGGFLPKQWGGIE